MSETIAAAEERYRLLVEGAKDYAMILMNPQARITSWNAGAERIMGWSEAEVLGQSADLIFTPEDCANGMPAQEIETAASEGKAMDLRWHLKKDGSRFFADGIMEGLRSDDGRLRGFAKVLRDATDRKALEDERSRFIALAENSTDFIGMCDMDGVPFYVNPAGLSMIGLTDMAQATQVHAIEFFHEADRNLILNDLLPRVLQDGHVEAEVRLRHFGTGEPIWVNYTLFTLTDGSGQTVGFATISRGITEQVGRTRRERFLVDLAERAREMTDPEEVIADAVRSVGEFLGVSRCIFADIDIEADTCTVRPDYRADPSSPSIEGVVPISAFGPYVVAEYAARRAVAVDDVRLDPIKAPPESVAAYEAIGIRAHVTVPVVHSDRVVSCMSVHNITPRHWQPEEVDLLRAVVERTWLTVEVLRQQRALVREAEELRAAHERTTGVLESITDAFFALDREFRFTYLNAQAERVLARTREELLGRGIWEEYPDAVGGPFYEQYCRVMAEGVPVSVEDFYPPFNAWLDVRAFPSADGISVFFQNVNARKALEAERERLAERERNIAQQLQAALTPSVPERIPGMALAKYYEAALDEAGVGGDFYDVFPVDKGCTALVVGDLSGKGLAAASQVATVRNMLRYALYRARTLAGALEGLNALLAEQGLLTGFATLFVGAYDSGTGTLTYVNCGQEPALVRRAKTGLVEQLVPTGAVLGSFEGAAFEERVVALGAGDTLAVFSDGLTEVGRSRMEMLGVNGVADLLAGVVVPEEADSAKSVAEHLALRLIAGVDAAAQGGVMRDDVCLLVGVVDGITSS